MRHYVKATYKIGKEILMKVTKVAEFTQEEIEDLQKAGSILGATAKAIVAGEIDTLNEEAAALIAALKEVIGRI